MRGRRRVVQAHRTLGAVLGIWVVLQGLTGATLVFQDQLNAWARPALFSHGHGDAGPAAALAAARRALPKNDRVTSLALPVQERGVYVATAIVVPPTGMPKAVPGKPLALPQRQVYVDPATSRVNGIRDPNAGFTHWLQRWHQRLLQDSFLGHDGTTLVDWLGALSVLVLVLGMYVWYWPGVRRWANALRLRRQRGPFTFRYDLHRMVGLIAGPLLAVQLLLGLNVNLRTQVRPWYYRLTPGPDRGEKTPATPPQSGPAAGRRPLPIDAALAAARTLSHGTVVAINPAAGPTSVYTVKVSHGWDPSRGPMGRAGNVTLYVDQYTGGLVRASRPEQKAVAGQLYEWWAFPLHTGSFGGTPTRFLWMLLGLAPALLFATGTGMWVARIHSRRRWRRRLRQALPHLPAPLAAAGEHRGERRTVPPGQVVVRQGDEATELYVIVSGAVDVRRRGRDGDDVHVRTLGAGEHFGEIGLLTGEPRTATVVAARPAELLVFDRATVSEMLDGSTRTSESVARTAAARMARDAQDGHDGEGGGGDTPESASRH
jgi:uncharacterized iron-regulated membrane protein